MLLIFIALLTYGAFAQPQVVPAHAGVVPDGSVPFRTTHEDRIIPAEVAKTPKNDDIPRQADDSLGISPSLAALQRLAGLTPNQAPDSFSSGSGASLAGLPNIPGLSNSQLESLQAFRNFQGQQTGGSGSLGGSSALPGALAGSGLGGIDLTQLANLPNFGGTSTGSVLPRAFGNLPQSLAGLSGVGAPQGQTGGLLNVLGSLGGSLGRSRKSFGYFFYCLF